MRDLMTVIPVWLCLAALPVAAQPRIPVIIDTDIGDAIDDALALAFALNSPELDVRGVTTVIDDVGSKTRLAYKELGLLGRRDIPLAMGASEPLLDPVRITHPREFEVLTAADTIPDAARRSAAGFIAETLMKSPEPITLVAIGPLTNIALALKIEPLIKRRIARIVLMGGAYADGRIEYNAQRDPAAAEIVFRSGVPITAVGLDVTAACKLREADLERLRVTDSPAARFLVHLIDLAREETGEDYPTLYDPLAMAVVFRPDLIETEAGRVDVSLNAATRGQTRFTPSAGENTRVAVKADSQAFLDLFISRVARGIVR